MNKLLLVLLGLLLIIFSGCSTNHISQQSSDNNYLIKTQSTQTAQTDITVVEKKDNNGNQSIEENNVEITTNPSAIKQKLPESITIDVPFSSQAPFANWDDDHGEACEEASILLANEFISGNKSSDLEKPYADSEIVKMILWERENWGGHFDLEIDKTNQLIQSFYKITNTEVVEITSVDDLKTYLSQGKIIIAPTAGRELGNPYFRQPGPVYHMLVIKGYESGNFITNDVGTRRGKDYKYQYEVLYNAIHDLPQEARGKEHYIKNYPELIEHGEKKILIIDR